MRNRTINTKQAPALSSDVQTYLDKSIQQQTGDVLGAFNAFLDSHDLTYEQHERITNIVMRLYTDSTCAAFRAGMAAMRKPELIFFQAPADDRPHRLRHRAQAEQ